MSNPLHITFKDSYSVESRVFDFSTLPVSPELSVLLADAFYHHNLDMAPRTRDVGWRAMRSFATFLADSSITRPRALDTTVIQAYVRILNQRKITHPDKVRPVGSPISMTLKRTLYTPAVGVLQWIIKNKPGCLADDILFPKKPFGVTPTGRGLGPKGEILDEQHLIDIVKACQREIDAAYDTFQEGQRLLATDTTILPSDYYVMRDLWYLNQVDNGNFLESKDLPHDFTVAQVLPKFGLSPDTLFPFYLLILIQTSGNPESIRDLRVDCLRPHVLYPDEYAILSWLKKRSKTEQTLSFPRAPKYSLPKLVSMLLEMTRHLRRFARLQFREKLFLCYMNVNKLGRVSVPGKFHLPLARFLERNGLEKFQIRDLRPSSLTYYNIATNDLAKTQLRANHQSAATTHRYIRGRQVRHRNSKVISNIQHQLFEWVLAVDVDSTHDLPPGAQNVRTSNAHLPFGICKDPLKQDKSPGKVCPHFLNCLTCPGLVVPDTPFYMAVFLRALRHLERWRPTISVERWEAIYSPAYQAINEEILPAMSPNHSDEAQLILKTLPTKPRLF